MLMQLFQVNESPFDPFVSTAVTSPLPNIADTNLMPVFLLSFFFFIRSRRRDGAEVWLVHAAALLLCCRLAPAEAEHRWCRSCRVPVADGLSERLLRWQHPLSDATPGEPHHGLLWDVRQPDHGPGSLTGGTETLVPPHIVLHCEDLVWLVCSLFFCFVLPPPPLTIPWPVTQSQFQTQNLLPN